VAKIEGKFDECRAFLNFIVTPSTCYELY